MVNIVIIFIHIPPFLLRNNLCKFQARTQIQGVIITLDT